MAKDTPLISSDYERFCRNLVAHLSSDGYRFAIPEGGLTQKAEPLWSTILTPGLVGTILFGSLFAGTPNSTSDVELYKELIELQQISRLASCKIIYGKVYLSILVEADDKNEAELIGSCSLLHEKFRVFRKFSTPVANTWSFWEKVGLPDGRCVFGRVMIAFNNSARATNFCMKTIHSCKHKTGGTFTLPVVVDVLAQRIEMWPGWPPALTFGNAAKLRDKLFIDGSGMANG